MANIPGGSVVWNLDIEGEDRFTAGINRAASRAKDLGNTLGALDFKGFADGASMAFSTTADAIGRVLQGALALGVTGSFGIGAMTKAAFEQVRQVENASFALRAYEKDAGKVNKVLAELVAFARSDTGVLFQREDLFKAASNLRAYGQSAESVTEQVKILARGVALGTTTFDELSLIVGRAAQAGELTSDAYDQLAYRGIVLDSSFRNATVSSKGLFEALAKTLPASLLEGRANTIDGVLIRLKSAFRDLGSTILGVDRETSRFVEGGAGARFVELINKLTVSLKQPAVKTAFASLGNQIAAVAEQAIPKLLEAITFLANNFDKIIVGIGGLVAAFVSLKAASAAIDILSGIDDVLKLIAKNPVVAVITALAAAFIAFGVETGLFKQVFDQLKPTFDAVGAALAPFGPIISQLVEQLGATLAPLVPVLTGLFIELVKALLPLLPPIVELVAVILPPLIQLLSAIVPILVPVIQVIGAALVFAVQAAVNILKFLVDVIRNVISWFVQLGKDVQTNTNNVVNAVRALPGFILDGLGNLGGLLLGAGRSLIDGLVNGIGSGAGPVINKVRQIANDVLNSVKGFFGINSPSRVMAEQGGFIMQGWANGIKRGASSVVSAANDVSSAVLDSFGMDDLSSPTVASVQGDNGRFTGSSGATINQTNIIQNQVDMDIAFRDLSWRLAN